MKIMIDCTIENETEIHTKTYHADVGNDYMHMISHTVVVTKDKMLRDALLKLGWTPPYDSEE